VENSGDWLEDSCSLLHLVFRSHDDEPVSGLQDDLGPGVDQHLIPVPLDSQNQCSALLSDQGVPDRLPVDHRAGLDVQFLHVKLNGAAPDDYIEYLCQLWFDCQQGKTLGAHCLRGYHRVGTSEAGWVAGSNETSRRLGSVGKPLPYHDLKIVDAAGKALPAGEIGQVELGNDAARDYRYVDPNGAVKVHATGRFRTGDLGYLDADGYLFITGRERDLIIRGGVNIAPIEIDGVLLQCDDVAEAATIGVPDPIYGEAVVSCVVRATGAEITEDALLAHCGATLPAFKAPKQILFRDALPKTERGKIDRKALIADWMRENPAGR